MTGTMLITCDIGDQVIVRATLIRTDTDQPVTGADVTARTLHENTETSLGAATDEGDGVYSATVTPDASGRWDVRFDSASPNRAAEEGVIWVRSTSFTTS